jgi:LPXTG-site transpeptidase (sortase) family protein
LRIPSKASRLIIGVGLLFILVSVVSLIYSAAKLSQTLEQVYTPDQSSHGPDTILIPNTEIGLLQGTSNLPTQTTAQNGNSQSTTPSPTWVPDWIVIPAIQLDAPVIPATLNTVVYQGESYGQWAAPRFFAAGLITTSASLGGAGNTVLIGHHNIYGEVFGRLIDLQVGDRIQVYSGDKKFDYAINLKLILPEGSQSAEVRLRNAQWMSPSNDERLTLVTCWPHENNSHRLIIVATPIHDSTIAATEIVPQLTPNSSEPMVTLNPLLNADQAQFVADITIPDGTRLTPGTKFIKTWRIKNVGQTTWTQQYVLESVGGAEMTLTSQVFFPQTVAPGQTVDLSIEMIAPDTLGPHTSLFQFRNSKGVPFGVGLEFNENIYVRIRVINNPSPTP